MKIANKDPGNWHFYTSMIKSIIRGFAGAALAAGNLYLAGVLLIAAEIFGVFEEL
tara:strand:- start:18 stop:182 length:165 start_codon:yes stop_codon:yes gene_type:complete